MTFDQMMSLCRNYKAQPISDEQFAEMKTLEKILGNKPFSELVVNTETAQQEMLAASATAVEAAPALAVEPTPEIIDEDDCEIEGGEVEKDGDEPAAEVPPPPPVEPPLASAPVLPPKPQPSLEEIQRAASILIAKGSGRVVELRALDTPERTWSGYYNSRALAKDTYELALRESVPNIYWTLQEIDTALIARRSNSVAGWVRETTADGEVRNYLYLPIDFDPCRLTGVSSNDAEKKRALELATEVRAWLLEHGIASILADSGNGYHLLVRISLLVSTESTGLVARILNLVARKFNTCHCKEGEKKTCGLIKTDRKLFNPSRILKAYGTCARKGSHTADRPWRLSRILDAPENVGVVSEETLRALAEEITKSLPAETAPETTVFPFASTPAPEGSAHVTPDMIEAEMARLGMEHMGRMVYKTGFKWQLKKCPFNPEHAAPDSYVAWESSGLYYFSCSHDSCAENCKGKEGFKKFKAQVGGFDFPRYRKSETNEVEAPAAWTTPLPVDKPLLPVPAFKLEYLPRAFRPWAKDVSERMSVPLDMVGISMMCCLAGVTGRRVFVRPKANDESWREPLNGAGVVVTDSGGMKTPTWKALMHPAVGVEIDWREEHAHAVKKYNAEFVAYKTVLAEFKARVRNKKKDKKKKDEDPVQDGETPNTGAPVAGAPIADTGVDVPPTPPVEPPPLRRLILNDATPEKVHTLMSQNPEGLLLYRDEVSGLLTQMDKPGFEQMREMFLIALNGNDAYSQDRMGRPDVFAIMCESFFGGLQPKVCRDLVSDERNANDGTIARMLLFCWPDERGECAPIDRPVDKEAKERYERVIRAIAEKRAEFAEARFIPSAQVTFTAWLTNQFKEECKYSGPMKSHVSKHKGGLPKLAALCQLADIVDESLTPGENDFLDSANGWGPVETTHLIPIDDEHLDGAIHLLEDFLKPHMKRGYACVRTPIQRSLASLAGHVEAGDLEDGFTARSVYQKGWANLAKPDDAKEAIEGLCEKGWLRPIPGAAKSGKKGGKPTVKYEINPVLKTGEK